MVITHSMEVCVLGFYPFLIESTGMANQGRRDDRKRRKREERKDRQRHRLDQRKNVGKKALTVLANLFNENTPLIIELAIVEDLSDAEIAERLSLPLAEVTKVVEEIGRLPVSISDILLKHPRVLANPEALKAIANGARGLKD